ncbi:hypothetical protein PR048_028975 [Dryococelus australis]|uniref:Reverse transcriptase n=1 Tax=Dryococelus australis TaxID=614101 RepID=A0ABQ9GC23_9NEOP|nr:hypothetical protein PR048_028975 [Dryococelus australis]
MRAQYVKYLGLYIDEHFNWSEHVNKVIHKFLPLANIHDDLYLIYKMLPIKGIYEYNLIISLHRCKCSTDPDTNKAKHNHATRNSSEKFLCSVRTEYG